MSINIHSEQDLEDLSCPDIDSEKDQDAVEYEIMQKHFDHEYHAASWQSVGIGKHTAYVTHLAANGSHSQLAATLSDNSLAVFDWGTLRPIHTLKGHSGKITGVRYVPGSSELLVSSSLDGSVRQWDSRTGQTTIEYRDKTLEKPKPLTCVDMNASGRFVCCGTELVGEDAYLVFWDVRGRKPLGGYWESHTDEVSTVRFHPSDSSALASGSTDGYVNVFDVTQTSEDDALQSTLNTESSVSSATWYEQAGTRHLAVVLDTEELQCWDPDQAERPRAQFGRGDVTAAIRRTMSETCYVADCVETAEGGILAVAGATTNQGRGCLRLLRLEGDRLRPHALLEDSEVTQQLVRATLYDPVTGGLVTGGEGGVLTLWKPGSGSGSAAPPRTDSKANSKHKTKKHKQKPY